MEHKVINLWSGPRNVSTALMYSFAQRNDTKVVDEPLYGHYLYTTDVNHPGQEHFIHKIELNAEKAIRNQILKYHGKPITFIKNMAHHLDGVDDSFLNLVENIFLIRHPSQMIPSLINQIPNPTIRDVALEQQTVLYKRLSRENKKPIIIDSKELLLNPKKILSTVCNRLSVPFKDSMLRWKMGALPEDGPWAPYWYQNIHQSTGFSPYKKKEIELPSNLINLLEESIIHYNFLYEYAIKTP